MATKPPTAAAKAAVESVEEDPSPAAVEARADALHAELAASIVPMSHPDGGTCAAYDTNKAGHILVPASEAAAMFDHGFVVVPDVAEKVS